MTEIVPLAGRYRFLRKLRGASSGVIWLAADERTGDTVVASSVTSVRTAGLKRGVGLVHDSLATLLDVLEQVPAEQIPGRMVLRAGMSIGVAVDVSGRTLQERLDLAGPLPPARAVNMTMRVVNALAYLHRYGAVHGAVSTQSVVIVRVGGQVIPVLSNLRVAAVGSFCSPERIGGEGPSTRDDTWGACVLLFSVLAGRVPFEGRSREQLMHAMTSGQLPQLANYGIQDAVLQSVIDRGFSTDPRVRFASAVELEQALSAWSSPDPVASVGRLSMADIAIGGAVQDDSVVMSDGAAALSYGDTSSSDDDGTDLDDDEIATMAIDVNRLREQMLRREASINSTVGALTQKGQASSASSGVGVVSSTGPAVPTPVSASAPSLPSIRPNAPPLRLSQSTKRKPPPVPAGVRPRQPTMVGLAPAAPGPHLQPQGQQAGLPVAPTLRGGAPRAEPPVPEEDGYTDDDDNCATAVFNPSALLDAVAKVRAAASGGSPSAAGSPAIPVQQAAPVVSSSISQPFPAPVAQPISGVSDVSGGVAPMPVPVAPVAAGVPVQHSIAAAPQVQGVFPASGAAGVPVQHPSAAALPVHGLSPASGAQGAVLSRHGAPLQSSASLSGKALVGQGALVGEGLGGKVAETRKKRGVFASLMLVFVAAISTVLVAVIAFVVALVVTNHVKGQREGAMSASGGQQEAGVEKSVNAASGAGDTENTANTDDAASSEGGDTPLGDAGGAADGGVEGDANQGKQDEQDVSACVVQFFPKDSFALPVSMDFVCTESNYQKIAQTLHPMIVQGGRGIVTQAMRIWAGLGWYEVAVAAVLQQNCCSAPLETSEAKPAEPCEDLDTVLRKVAKGTCSEEQIKQRTDAVAEAIGCYFKHNLPRPYPSYNAPPRPHNRQAFTQFLEGIDPSRCAKTEEN